MENEIIEVEKMYGKVGVKPEYDYFTAIKYSKIVQYFHLNKKELVDNIVDKIKYCKKNILIKVIRVDKDYPDFTAEKQLSLIKWLVQNKRLCVRKAEHSNNFYMDTIIDRSNGVDNKIFEVCLASQINNLWQDLTEQEKKEIREILDGD